jgi:hypothetical protein
LKNFIEKDTKSYNQKSDLEIKIIFEFKESVYSKIYEAFSFLNQMKKLGEGKFKPHSISLDKSSVTELFKNCSSDLFIQLFHKYHLIENLSSFLDIKIEIVNSNILIKGNYLKFSREIGQSPWELNGVKLYHSVEEEIKKELIPLFQCDNCIMSAGGREDRDVRMLGSGRPFILEIMNPKKKYK